MPDEDPFTDPARGLSVEVDVVSQGREPVVRWRPTRWQRVLGSAGLVVVVAGYLLLHLTSSGPSRAMVPDSAGSGYLKFHFPTTSSPAWLPRCLHAGGSSAGLVPFPATVLLGGQQLIKVDLETGTVTPLGRCRPGAWQTVVPMPDARVVWTRHSDGSRHLQLTDQAGRTTQLHAGTRPWDRVSVTNDGQLLVAQPVKGAQPSRTVRLATYDASGHLTSTVTASGGLTFVVGSTVEGIAAATRDSLVLLDPATGKILRTIGGRVGQVLGAGEREVAWRQSSRSLPGGTRCATTCSAFLVTDLVTGQTRSYGGSASRRPIGTAVFSPDGQLVALTTVGTPSATVEITNLRTRATTVIPVTEYHANLPVAWTPDGQALVVAETTRTAARLLVWHRTDGTVTTAARLSGQMGGTAWLSGPTVPAALAVLGPSLNAWQ